jgi:hypothetical protein
MSTLAFAAFTNRREEAVPGTSSSSNPPGVSTFVDAVAALVPTEVLTLHALILSVTTTTAAEVTTITDATTLRWAFAGLILLSIVLYVVPRFKNWVLLDYIRVAIPPLAFVGWTMLQRSTAFDAIAPSLTDASRTVAGLFLAAVLGVVAVTLARKADETTPPVNG